MSTVKPNADVPGEELGTLTLTNATSKWDALNDYDDTKFVTWDGGTGTGRIACGLDGFVDETVNATTQYMNIRLRRVGTIATGSFLQITTFSTTTGKYWRTNIDGPSLPTSFVNLSLLSDVDWISFGGSTLKPSCWVVFVDGAGNTGDVDVSYVSFGTLEPVIPQELGTATAQGQARAGGGGTVTGLFDIAEVSQHDGAPLEAYLFTQDTVTYRYTSGDVSATVGAFTYTPEVIKRNPMDFSQEEGAASLEVRLPRTNAVAQLGIGYTPPTPVELIIYRYHRGLAQVVTWFNGQVTAWRFEGSEAILSCAPISQVLKRKIPSLVQQYQCNWTLYGVGCTVDRTAFKTTATIDAISGSTITASPEFGAQVDGWFSNGYVEIVATKERRFIVAHVGNVLTLMSPFQGLTVGMSVDAYAGCDRTESICASKFSNLDNHLGFARIPQRNPFDGAMT